MQKKIITLIALIGSVFCPPKFDPNGPNQNDDDNPEVQNNVTTQNNVPTTAQYVLDWNSALAARFDPNIPLEQQDAEQRFVICLALTLNATEEEREQVKAEMLLKYPAESETLEAIQKCEKAGDIAGAQAIIQGMTDAHEANRKYSNEYNAKQIESAAEKEYCPETKNIC